MRFDIVTLFPELVSQVAKWGIVERAHRKGVFELQTWNPRDYTGDVHKTVDGRPYGGGPGMVMMYQPLRSAVEAAQAVSESVARVVYMSPQGRPLTQALVQEFSAKDRIILVAGRYEGVDERFIDDCVDEEISMGDYVLSGGELPAMAFIDAVVRLLPEALGHHQSAEQDSFVGGLLDCPHYTRPMEVAGKLVPAVLQSGNHSEIDKWRHQKALEKTTLSRPDLLADLPLTDADLKIIEAARRKSGKGLSQS